MIVVCRLLHFAKFPSLSFFVWICFVSRSCVFLKHVTLFDSTMTTIVSSCKQFHVFGHIKHFITLTTNKNYETQKQKKKNPEKKLVLLLLAYSIQSTQKPPTKVHSKGTKQSNRVELKCINVWIWRESFFILFVVSCGIITTWVT